ncbi:MAG: hypothetical protein RLZZ576_192 [Actinomycetota bacterium]|jgi:predicted ester cyclase
MQKRPKEIVENFLKTVRSGLDPYAAAKFMAPVVTAHQVVSEAEVSIERTPDEYAEHVIEMKLEFGDFVFEITELISENDKVFARWKQVGRGVTQVTSCVYRIKDSKIVEYWIQIDRLGLQLQNPELTT